MTTLKGNASKMTLDFFNPLLVAAHGDTTAIKDYLKSQMEIVQ
jgi:hypothetical protein